MVQIGKGLATLVLAAGIGWGGGWPAGAQTPEAGTWIQIEARNSRPVAEDRVRHWAGDLPQVAGFALASGWYAVALGPYPADEAARILDELRASGAIPADSFITDPRLFRDRFWPAADTAADAATPAPPPPTAPEAAAPAPAAPPTAAPTATPAETAPPAAPVETLADAKRDEAALSRNDRMDIQRALQWFGTYDSGIDGAFGPGTRGSINAWQARIGAEETGYLTPSQRAQLLAGWQDEVAAIDLQTITDNEAGIEIALPLGLVGFDRYTPPFAQYGARNDSGMQVWLISAPGDQAALDGLFDLLGSLAIMPADGPRNRRPGAFDMSGMTAEVETWAEARLDKGAIRGFLITARSGDAARTARIRQAMKAGFRAVGTQVLDPGLEPLDDATRAGLLAGVAVRQPDRAASGFYIDDQGRVLTAAANVADCARVTLDGAVEATITSLDAGAGLALLQPKIALAPTAFARLAATLPATGSAVALAGFSYGTQLPLPLMTFGRLAATTTLDGDGHLARLDLGALPGDVGGPVLGPDGQVIGLLQPAPVDPARILPPSVAYLTPAPLIARTLALETVTTAGSPLPPEDLTAAGLAMVAQVACWGADTP